jgi:hypothetical protein
MTRGEIRTRTSIGIQLCIWSVRSQAWLAGQVRIYVYTATAMVAFLALAGVISIQTAMFATICGGTIFMGLIWTLVHQRRAMLLKIQDPAVREQAHSAMIAYLQKVDSEPAVSARSKALSGAPQKACRECGLFYPVWTGGTVWIKMPVPDGPCFHLHLNEARGTMPRLSKKQPSIKLLRIS